MLIFFDFDGTLSNMSERWWRLHFDVTKECGLPWVMKKKYIAQKRNAISEKEIMRAVSGDEKKIEQYVQKRISYIEKQKYLARDHLVSGAKAILRACQKHGDLVLLTKRHSAQNFFRQIKRYNVGKYFNKMLITDGLAKEVLLKRLYKNKLAGSYLITDSLEEIQMGKKMEMKTVAIGYGTRSASFFKKHGVQAVIRTPKELLNYIKYALQS